MFDNIGGKIKALAIVVAWVGMILGVLCGLIIMGSGQLVSGFLVMVLGLLAFPASYCLYGIGDLVKNVAKLAAKAEKHEG